MRSSSTDLDTLRFLLERGSDGDVRLVIERRESGAVAKRLLFEVSPRTPELPTRSWDYGDVIMLSGQCPAPDVAAWLTQPGVFQGQEFSLPTLHEQVGLEEHASLSLHAIAPLEWPFAQYQLSPQAVQGDPTQLPAGRFLVCRNDAPSFRSVGFAVNEFLLGLSDDRGYGLPLLVRIARTDAWIQHVHLTPTSMRVEIAGDSIRGCRVELLADGDQHQGHAVGAGGMVIIPLPQGLPLRSQLLLSRDGEWRDDRFLDPAHRVGRSDFSSESGDRTADLEVMLSAGEGQAVEFKGRIPHDPSSRRSSMKTVAAFANGEGGTLMFGVDADDAKVVGIQDPAQASDTVSALVRSWVTPVPDYGLEIVQVQSVAIVMLTVAAGKETPYGIRMNGEVRYFVRRGATTFPAEPHEVRAAVVARQSQSAAARRFGEW